MTDDLLDVVTARSQDFQGQPKHFLTVLTRLLLRPRPHHPRYRQRPASLPASWVRGPPRRE